MSSKLFSPAVTFFTLSLSSFLLPPDGVLVWEHADERALGLHLLQFSEIFENACSSLLPSVLCDYLYNLSNTFSTFYANCQVDGSNSGSKATRAL